MKISANQIAEWAKTGEAQRELPRLVRKLIHSVGTVTKISVPAGDAISQPGFDGEVFSENGNAWVPKGHSVWEMSCRADVEVKANEDYKKRIAGLNSSDLGTRTYISVTARKWSNRVKWQQKKLAEGHWADMRAYDAHDLEEWLEQCPAVALELAEALGLSGPGVESPGRYWNCWSTQSDPKLSTTAILAGRNKAAEGLVSQAEKHLNENVNEPLSVKADSVEEAVAFIVGTFLEHDELSAATVVITDENGWRYVEKNEQIRIAIAARPEIAASPTSRNELLLVLPYASGDMSGHFRGVAGKAEDTAVRLERPNHGDFDEALKSLGIDENDARRLSLNCGRSWTVFRRNHAKNPTIRRPAWLDHPYAPILSTLCLINGWASDRDADRSFVEKVAGKPYTQIETDLIELERLDDSPVIRIGSIWKAKSALDLLAVFGERISDDQFNRFFAAAKEVLATPDPQLELPDEERYKAVILGKAHPYSGLLTEALSDSLIKLAVRGGDLPALQFQQIEGRVTAFVRDLLHNADEKRWLSLSGRLPALAEAAPESFLAAIENSLAQDNAPVRALMEETQGSGLFGRCWHAGLLWALETLAWKPELLSRVCLILAALTTTDVKGNWANTPANTLVDIFRSWFPQTGANIEQRIAVLDVLIKRFPDASYALLNRLTDSGPDHASHTQRPRWRDDDAGAGQGATGKERYQMLVAAADRQIAMAKGNAHRVAKLIPKLSDFDDPRIKQVFALVDDFSSPEICDDQKDIVRSELRQRIHWHRNNDDAQGHELNKKLKPFEDAYYALEPTNLVKRHAWLFANSWIELPLRTRDEKYSTRQSAANKWRKEALQEIYDEHGWVGLVELSDESTGGWQIGLTIQNLGNNDADLTSWIAHSAGDFEAVDQKSLMVGGLLSGLDRDHMISLVNSVLKIVSPDDWSENKIARFLTLAPECKAVWNFASVCGKEVERQYWLTCPGNLRFRDGAEEFQYGLDRLIEAQRPRTALSTCHFDFEHIEMTTLVNILEGILRGEEDNARIPESYYFRKVLDHIEASGEIKKDRLIQLEFGLIPFLSFNGEQHAKTLMQEIMSDANLFVELLCLAYRPRNRDKADEEVSEGDEAAAHNAFTILHNCRIQPGTDENGSVDAETLLSFVSEAQGLATEKDRLEVCNITLGEILARGPIGEDGTFPFEPSRDVLDRIENEDMRQGFHTGCYNKRGVMSRNPYDGGDQERELVDFYRTQANAFHDIYPYLSGILEKLAKTYENEGLRHDLDAKLRREER